MAKRKSRKSPQEFPVVSPESMHPEEEPETPEERIWATWTSVPTGLGLRAKLHHIDKQGNSPIVSTIDDPESVEDWDAWLIRMAQENGYPAGKYVLRMYDTGLRRWAAGWPALYIHLSEHALRNNRGGAGGASSPEMAGALGMLSQAAEAAVKLKELAGGSGAGNIAELAKVLNENLRQGVDLTKQALGVSDNAGKGSATEATAAEKWVGAVSTALTAMKSLGIVGREPPDPIEQLTKLQEAGILPRRPEGPPEKPEDVVDQVTKITQLIDGLAPLLGGRGGEPTIGIEIVRNLAPHVPVIIERVTHTIDKGIDFARFRMLVNLGQVPMASVPAGRIPPSHYATLAREITMAIRTNDDSRFIAVHNAVLSVGPEGRGLLEGLQAGTLGIEETMTLLGGLNLPEVGTPQGRAYIERFVGWERAAGPTEPAAPPPTQPPAGPPAVRPADEETGELRPGEVLTACDKCAIEIVFDSWQHFESDDLKCREAGCEGRLERKEEA